MTNYYFICACGCGQMSELLGKDGYIRLRKGQKWYAKDCVKETTEKQEFKDGYIVKEADF